MADPLQSAAHAVLVSTGVFGVYGALLPSPSSLPISAPDSVASMRQYVVQADAISLTLGASSAVLSRSWAPLLGAVAVVAYMHVLYGKSLNTDAPSF